MKKTCAHLTLDVGAGTRFTHIPRTINLRTSIRTDISVNEVNRPFIDVMSDAQYLPFRNNVFDVVSCSHVIEHVRKPTFIEGIIKSYTGMRHYARVH